MAQHGSQERPQEASKNDQKSNLCPERGARKRPIFPAQSVFLTLGLAFSAIFGEHVMKFSMHLSKAARDFFNVAMG